MRKTIILTAFLVFFACVYAKTADTMGTPPSRTCIPFQIALDTANCSKLPVLSPTDQYLYLDLCPGETVQLSVKGIYNGTGDYTPSDATPTCTWHLGSNSDQSGTGLTTITHTFPPGNGCEVSVSATDVMSCPVQIPVTFRVRVSDNPIQSIQNIPQLCVGQTVTPTIGTAQNNQFVLSPVGYAQPASLAVSDTVFLPDGDNCPPYGLYYRSEITFTDFPNNAVLTSANDILYVRIKMEHSAIEDLQIHIVCPNGSSSSILPYPNYNIVTGGGYDLGMMRINLGSAYRPDGGTCNPALNTMGEPWNYIWSNNSTLGYSYASGNGVLYDTSNFHSHYNPHWDASNYFYFNDTEHSYSVDSTNVAQMTQVYHPYQSFSSLVGCPLNGVWYIQVQDMLPYDNGYIVEWELALNSELMPTGWGYYMTVDSFYFSGNNVVNGVTLQPESFGNQPYSMTIIDNFGCEYDTTFSLIVHAIPDANLGDDRYICPGESVTLAPASTNSDLYHWSTGATDPQITVSQPGSYSLTAKTMNGFTVLCENSDTVEVFLLPTSDTTLTDALCAGVDYSANGFSISGLTLEGLESYTETRTVSNQFGCDSVVTLELTVLPRYNLSVEKYACEQYVWEGDTLTESGDYTKTFTSADGCDSTVTLTLSIGRPAEEEVWATVCGQYVWNGETFTESGDYVKYFSSVHECDSMVTLHLTVLDTFLRTSVSNPDFCTTHETELSVEGNFDDYLWSTGEVGTAIMVTESGLYSLTASNVACQQVERFQIPFCPLNFLLPNAISPSKSDGLNDCLALSDYDKSQIGEFTISIYDRWGELVFWSNDKNFRWDGSKEGKLPVDVVYNYLVRCTDRNGKTYVFRGSVTVL